MPDLQPDDRPTSVDHLANYVHAYNRAKQNEAIHLAKAKEWKAAADGMRDEIVTYMADHDSNVGLVDGQLACRWTRWSEDSFDVKTFRKKEPSLVEEYTKKIPKTRFTAYGGISAPKENLSP